MNAMKKILALLLSMAMLLSMAAGMTSCGGGTTSGDASGSADVPGENTTYTINIESMGGMPLDGVEVYVYIEDDLKQYGQTNGNGAVSFEMPQNDNYSVQLAGVPKGYHTEERYILSGTATDIALKSSVITDETLSNAGNLGLGDIMYDFTVTTPAGESITLSEMLKEKEMVLLNFWYTTCTYCVAEFPFMEEAYQMYQDKVGIVAVDPLDSDNDVANFQQNMGLTFPMATCPATWSSVFGIQGYPTSVIIDRYGVITLIEVGGMTSLSPFLGIFDAMTGDDYEQKLYGSASELVVAVKPTYEMPSSEEISAVIDSGEINVTYRAEEEDEYCWPFIIDEKNGAACVKASNQQIDGSYAILYADVELKAGQAVAFDYLISSERSADFLYAIVDGEDVYAISGNDENEEWKACYPWVAETDGTYEVALCYLKDEANNHGDDTVYIKNMRVVDASAIDTPTYIPRYAFTTKDGFEYSYVDVVLNEKDGYYHVGSANGPLLLANLMGYSEFNEEKTVWDLVYNGEVTVNGQGYYDEMVEFFSYASNSALNGYCTVTAELAELLKIVAETAGFDGDENEWLKICSYYEAYGANGQQLVDPIKGLAPFCAYEAKLGGGNSFYYDRAIIPRGLLAEFVPNKSGVYRITSSNESQDGVEGWIFDENKNELLVYEAGERLFNDAGEVSMVFYMEAGKPYYIDIAFWDVYEAGYIYYDIEYLGSSYKLFRTCAPAYFTYDSDATGDAMYYLIHGGIDVVLGDDGYYYEDLGNGRKGSKIYCDFTGVTGVFDTPIATVNSYDENGNVVKDANGNIVKIKGMIEKGGFDFSKSEYDQYVLTVMANNNNDPEATIEALKKAWGEDYEASYEIYMVDDVLAGKYHGEGEDYTAVMERYLDKIITSGGKEIVGCVPVDEQLAEVLQMLMDKFTFENVEDSWIKLCYYYDNLGA